MLAYATEKLGSLIACIHTHTHAHGTCTQSYTYTVVSLNKCKNKWLSFWNTVCIWCEIEFRFCFWLICLIQETAPGSRLDRKSQPKSTATLMQFFSTRSSKWILVILKQYVSCLNIMRHDADHFQSLISSSLDPEANFNTRKFNKNPHITTKLILQTPAFCPQLLKLSMGKKLSE